MNQQPKTNKIKLISIKIISTIVDPNGISSILNNCRYYFIYCCFLLASENICSPDANKENNYHVTT